MGFFKRILGDESDLINELCNHLRQIGVNAIILDPESVEAKAFGGLGNIKIEGRNIEFVQVTKHTHAISAPKGKSSTYTYYLYHYGIKANAEGIENKLNSEAKPIQKGFFSREIVDYKWEGGELAQLLNSDINLKNTLIKEQIDRLWTGPSKNLQYVWITRRGERKEFPTRETFEAYNRIMQHIQNIIKTKL